MTEKDILARLQAGESAEAIGNELIAALNAANASYIQEQKEKEEAARKAKEAEAAREAKMDEAVSLITKGMNLYCELTFGDGIPVDEETVRQMLDATTDLSALLGPLMALTPASSTIKPKDVKVIKVDPTASFQGSITGDADKIIKDFLKSIC